MRRKELICWCVMILLLLAMAALATACVGYIPPTQLAGNHIARAQVYVEAAKEDAGHKGQQAAEHALQELDGAAKASDATGKQIAALQAESVAQATKLEAYHNQWIGDRTARWFRTWVVAVLVAIAVRVAGLFVSGPVGAILSYGGSLALAVLSFGLTLLVQAADNAWFRWLKPSTGN